MILRLMVAMFGGLALHAFYKPSLTLRERWANLLRYAIGYLGAWPFVLLTFHGVKVDDDGERLSVAYLLAGMFVGVGVFIGHLMDKMSGDKEG